MPRCVSFPQILGLIFSGIPGGWNGLHTFPWPRQPFVLWILYKPMLLVSWSCRSFFYTFSWERTWLFAIAVHKSFPVTSFPAVLCFVFITKVVVLVLNSDLKSNLYTVFRPYYGVWCLKFVLWKGSLPKNWVLLEYGTASTFAVFNFLFYFHFSLFHFSSSVSSQWWELTTPYAQSTMWSSMHRWSHLLLEVPVSGAGRLG